MGSRNGAWQGILSVWGQLWWVPVAHLPLPYTPAPTWILTLQIGCRECSLQRKSGSSNQNLPSGKVAWRTYIPRGPGTSRRLGWNCPLEPLSIQTTSHTQHTHTHTRSFCTFPTVLPVAPTPTVSSHCIPGCWQADFGLLTVAYRTEKLYLSHHFVSFKPVGRPVGSTPGRKLRSPAQGSPATVPPPDPTSKRPRHRSAPPQPRPSNLGSQAPAPQVPALLANRRLCPPSARGCNGGGDPPPRPRPPEGRPSPSACSAAWLQGGLSPTGYQKGHSYLSHSAMEGPPRPAPRPCSAARTARPPACPSVSPSPQ